jgi:hypothetical protein
MGKMKKVNKVNKAKKANKANKVNMVKKVSNVKEVNNANDTKKSRRRKKEKNTGLSNQPLHLLRSQPLTETLSPYGDNLADVNPEFFFEERELRQRAAENRAFNRVFRKTGLTKKEKMCRDEIEKELSRQDRYYADMLAARK